MSNNRGRRGSHLDSLDTLLDMVDYACEHNIAKDTSDSYDFALPPELPRAEFHDFLDAVGFEPANSPHMLPPSPIVTTKAPDGGLQRSGSNRYNMQNVQELLRQAGAYHHHQPQQQQQERQQEQQQQHQPEQQGQRISSTTTSNAEDIHSSSGGGGSSVSRTAKSTRSHGGSEARRPEQLLDLQELAAAQPECPVVAPKVWLRKGVIGVHSKTGYKECSPDWECQDAYTICRGFNDKRDQAFFAVFDGHGDFGGEAARTCAEQIPLLLRDSGYETGYIGAFRRLCMTMQKELRRCEEIDVTTSGCTACMLLINAGNVVCANVGDSRCVIYSSLSQEDPDVLVHLALTVDHKPDRPDERRRIEGRGGFVQESKIDSHGRLHPSRVVANNQDGGLAMSRSLGDTESHSAGVIPDPEIKQHALSELDQIIVLASDGIWDVMDEEELGKLLSEKLNEGPAWDLNAVAASICKECQSRWLLGGSYVDDITIVLVHLPRLLFDMATDLPPARSATRRHSHSLPQQHPIHELRHVSSELTILSARPAPTHRSAAESEKQSTDVALSWQHLQLQQAQHPVGHSSTTGNRRTRSEPPLPRRPVSLPPSLRHGLQDYIAAQALIRNRVRGSGGNRKATASSISAASNGRSRSNMPVK